MFWINWEEFMRLTISSFNFSFIGVLFLGILRVLSSRANFRRGQLAKLDSQFLNLQNFPYWFKWFNIFWFFIFLTITIFNSPGINYYNIMTITVNLFIFYTSLLDHILSFLCNEIANKFQNVLLLFEYSSPSFIKIKTRLSHYRL